MVISAIIVRSPIKELDPWNQLTRLRQPTMMHTGTHPVGKHNPSIINHGCRALCESERCLQMPR